MHLSFSVILDLCPTRVELGELIRIPGVGEEDVVRKHKRNHTN